ncbi:MAG: cytidylate kinase family protein [Desulfuromonadales bacterium]|jgi:cytidylate kinase|nr:cytidylate kinase family protein [Desulfuromonadales bacterium]
MAIITISREMGGGGIPIAHQAAEDLGYKLIDGDAIKELAPQYGLTNEVLTQIDEKPPAFIEKLDRQIELGVHRIQLIILEQSLKGNVIIYGRGGQDLLPNINSVFRVRIIAPFEDRVERWAEREWIDPDLAHSMVRKSDQQRAGFIKYYHDRDWEDPLHYDLVINTVRLSFDMAVKLIIEGVTDKNLVENKDAGKKKLRDLIIQKKIQIARLADERIEDIYFDISVLDGVVTLEGHVYSEAERKVAIADTREVEGVVKVIDRLKVVGYRSTSQDQ